nr:DnaJ heat shock amino-terminal domain protein [Ipomoea batatas]
MKEDELVNSSKRSKTVGSFLVRMKNSEDLFVDPSGPRFYAVINQVLSPGFKLLITWLEPDPDNEDERKWVLEGLPATLTTLISNSGVHVAPLVKGWKGKEVPKGSFELDPASLPISSKEKFSSHINMKTGIYAS